MALTVRDIMELPCGQKMTLLAGAGGLDRPVVTVEIADYEFDPDVGYDAAAEMDPDGFIITSFLFAKDDPELILRSVRQMSEIGMACIAFKRIIYEELPAEVIAFAEANNFPIFAMEKDLWFEKITFEIMYAVQFDDRVYLSEEKIDSMLSGSMNRSELDIILKGISLKLQRYVAAVYITGGGLGNRLDTGRILRSFYSLKGFHSKGLLVPFGNGLFLITTSPQGDHKSHNVIRREAMELLGIEASAAVGMSDASTGARDASTGARDASAGARDTLGMMSGVTAGMSDVHEYTHLDQAFRESWHCCIASAVRGKPFEHFGKTGIYRMLLPALDHDETTAFATSLLQTLASSADLLDTAQEYVASGGDVAKTAASIHCHQNTVRYRLNRIRQLTDLQDETDSELYLQLKTAIIIERAKAVIALWRG